MFQLIVAVISIALVAALAIASLYYGGQAFQKSSLKANVTTLVNGGQQIAGAMALYKTDNSGLSATDIDDLVTGEYLAAIPGVSGAATGAWTLNSTGTVAHVNVAGSAENITEICTEVSKQSGVAYSPAALLTDFDGQFGCALTVVDGDTVFAFKL